jgi:hypothetical protein
MKKRAQEYRFNLEVHTREAIERKFQCPATMETALTGPETGQRTIFKFELHDPAKTIVYAWNEPREYDWAPPKVIMVPANAEVTSEIAALEFQARSVS